MVIKQTPGKGNTNLLCHVKSKHPEVTEMMEKSNEDSLTSSKISDLCPSKVSNHALTTYHWLEFIVMSDLPLEIVEDSYYRRFSKFESISRNTIKKYFKALNESVGHLVKERLPERFGLIFDGWTSPA